MARQAATVRFEWKILTALMLGSGALPPKLVYTVKVSFLDVAALNPPARFPPRYGRWRQRAG